MHLTRMVAVAACFAASSCWAVTPPCAVPKYGLLSPLLMPARFERSCAEEDKLTSHFASEANRRSLGTASNVKTFESIKVEAHGAFSSLFQENQTTATAATIEGTAGTFGDPSRYLQLLPGVLSDNDQRNDFLVRGGNPSENFFVIDGIPVPSINHLALSDTTGGFVSMIDNAAIRSLTLHAGVHDARFDDRLSSVVEINTVPESQVEPRRTLEVGLGGVGGVVSRPLGSAGSLLISGRRSILNLLTSDIGMNGVPIYTNSLLRADQSLGSNDRFWGISLTGVDSLSTHPDPGDAWETNAFDVKYSGWRNTTGGNWQHLFTANTFSLLTVSNSEQAQKIDETAQLLDDSKSYSENTHEGISTATYAVTSQARSWLLASAGMTQSMARINYQIDQPLPLPNAYNPSPASSDTTSIRQNFSTPSSSAFAQSKFLLPAHAAVTLGIRSEHWSFGDHTSLSPRATFSVPVGSHMASIGFAEYSQRPAFLYLLSFPANHALKPIRAQHLTFDVDLIHTHSTSVNLSAYRKLYFDYPVAAAYPQLSLANIADTFGQSFLMFQMASAGRGRTSGVELSFQTHTASRLQFSANVTYARSWYSGLDGVLRRGNFDIPLSVNMSSRVKLGKGFGLAVRYSGASGRPYTPDDIVLSTAQNRDVYDLTRVNLARSAAYGRLDFRIEQDMRLHGKQLSWNVGLLNAFGRNNFYSYQWKQRAGEEFNQFAAAEQDQMPRFPEGSIKYIF